MARTSYLFEKLPYMLIAASLRSRCLWLFLLIIVACQSPEHPAKGPDLSEKEALAQKLKLDKILLPPGFLINVFALVPDARSICWGVKGTLFVGNRNGHNVYACVDKDGDGISDSLYTIAEGLNSPNGVAFREGSLYVAEINRILRFDQIELHLSDPPPPVVVFDRFPSRKQHGWKYIAFGPDGKLYVPVGAPCNICNEKDSIFATITRMNPDGTGLEIYARGVRNSVGFAWHPETAELWFTDNGRDNLGDDIPNCELNHAPHKGLHFGFPFCHQGDIPDPEFGKGVDCSRFTPPAQKLGPHVAPLGICFYTGSQFPQAYKNRLFIAQHGSWNRSVPIGYRVMMAQTSGDSVTSYEPFATGWLSAGGEVRGRPVDVKVGADGSLYISDDKNGAIYRVSWKGGS